LHLILREKSVVSLPPSLPWFAGSFQNITIRNPKFEYRNSKQIQMLKTIPLNLFEYFVI